MLLDYKELNKQITNKVFSGVYLFIGDEDYLKDKYAERIITAHLSFEERQMNLSKFTQDHDLNAISEIILAAPFLAEKRIVIIKNSGFFEPTARGKAANTPVKPDKTARLLDEIPGSAILVFIENKADKRLALYKTVLKLGVVTEFKTPSDNTLVDWVIREAKNNGRVIAPPDAAYFVQVTVNNMYAKLSELNKLIDYSEEIITKHDIDTLTVKSSEANIFELVDAIAKKNVRTALKKYDDLLRLREHPIMTLAMIARQFRLIHICAVLKKQGKSASEIARLTNLQDFVVKNILSQSRNFTGDAPQRILRYCLETDISIKTGLINEKLGVLLVIVKGCMGETYAMQEM